MVYDKIFYIIISIFFLDLETEKTVCDKATSVANLLGNRCLFTHSSVTAVLLSIICALCFRPHVECKIFILSVALLLMSTENLPQNIELMLLLTSSVT